MPVTGSNISLSRKIIDDSFQEDIPESYDLFIYIDASEISCTVADRKSKKFIALESWQLDDEDFSDPELLPNIRKESTLLSLSGYPTVICCTGFRTATLVPGPLFEPGTAADQLQFSHDKIADGHLLVDQLHQLEASTIFTIPAIVYKNISSWFYLAGFHHTSTALIEFLLNLNKNSKEELVTINVHSRYMDVIVTRGRMLLLYNTFSFDSAEELVYYLLFVCEQLHLNPDHISVQCVGEINESDAPYQLARKYIRNLFLASRPETYEYAGCFDELPEPLHFNLFSQVICAS